MGGNRRKTGGGGRAQRAWTGPLILSRGFRPFFLLAGLFAALAIGNWLLLLGGGGLEPAMPALDWHIHEMLFGYSSAAIAGFLLTAVPNWTGRLPVTGWPLAWLALVWLAGRLAMLLPVALPAGLAGAVDALFLPLLALLIGREVILGRNWRNLKVLAPLAVLAGADIWFLASVNGDAPDGPDGAIRLAFAAIVMLIMLIGGRIIPSFTRNWLARQGPGRLPVPFNRFDTLALGAAMLGFAAWVALPDRPATGALLWLAGGLQAVRMARWAGLRSLPNPLLAMLHAAYAFLPAGLLLLGAAVRAGDPSLGTAGLHLFAIGGIGGMTAAVMLRASLGHTGRALKAEPITVAMFALIALAAVLRALGAVLPGAGWLITAAGLSWIAAFGIFTLRVGPWLLRPRQGEG